MRHGKKNNHLSRTKEHRKALFKNLTLALVQHKRIRTTLAKAKALRRYVEPLLTKAKTNTTHSRRVVFSYLQHKQSIDLMFGEIAARIANRPGGYTRVLRAGFRPNDSAEMAYIELVDFNEAALEAQTAKRRRTRRSRSTGKTTEVSKIETPTEPAANNDDAPTA